MRLSDFICECLAKHGVRHAFGIPGGVILDLVYAFDRNEKITPHLCFHEQDAGFAASGYSQTSNELSVCYVTRGPGASNIITPIADAFFDSIPCVFITAHANTPVNPHIRIETDQEWCAIDAVNRITKYAKRVDTVPDAVNMINEACKMAMSGRKGPVFLDFLSSLFSEEVLPERCSYDDVYEEEPNACEDVLKVIEEINAAKKPVILIGDGIRQSGSKDCFRNLASGLPMPIISSRYSADIVNDYDNYVGYVGSHGCRAANIILEKSDLILSLGNRMSFPRDSESYSSILKKKIYRLDIDEGEFSRSLPEAINIHGEVSSFISGFIKHMEDMKEHCGWLQECMCIKEALRLTDINDVVKDLAEILSDLGDFGVIVSDVGNNEFWLSRTCVYMGLTNPVLYSKSFGALGCSLGKAIGAYYAYHSPVVCICGDQGFQMNTQELQFISDHNVPMYIIIMNNRSSGMIRDYEYKRYDGRCLHATMSDGYSQPDFSLIAKAYGINYSLVDDTAKLSLPASPCIIDYSIRTDDRLIPYLPKGNSLCDMYPELDESIRKSLIEIGEQT